MKTPKTIDLNSMTLEELQGRLKIFAARAKHLCGVMPNGKPLGAAVSEFFSNMLSGTSDPEQIRQRSEFLTKAESDPLARVQLCGIRVETISNYLLANVNIIPMFFEIVNLGDDERPVFQNTTDQEVRVSYVGFDGGLKSAKVVKDDDEMLITMKMVTTERLRYRRVDIYRGTIVDAAVKTLRMGYDLANQMDKLAFTLLTDPTLGAFGAFNYPSADGTFPAAGAQPARNDGRATASTTGVDYTWVPNSRINPANLPTTNDIVAPDNNANTSFRFSLLKLAKKYEGMWQGAFPQGPLMLTGRILIPGADAADIADEIVPSGNTNNRVADNLLETGYTRINYLGRDWDIITDNTLTPGSLYCELNRKPGRAYYKPSMDREMVRGEEVYELSINNEEERWAQKPFGIYINNACRMNVLRIKYRS